MSYRLLKLAWATPLSSGLEKCLLMCLAEHHNDKNNQCNPGIERLARMTSMSTRSVIRNMQKLHASGLISVKRNGGDGGGAGSNKYTLHLGQCDSQSPTQCDSQSPTQCDSQTTKCDSQVGQCDSQVGQCDSLSPEPLDEPLDEPLEESIRSFDLTKVENDPDGQTGFDRWWSTYPKKVKKKTSRAIWKRIKPDAQQLIADVENRIVKDVQWMRGYIPDPTTYLNQERWTDEIQRLIAGEFSEDQKYGIRKQREAAIISEIDGRAMEFDESALPPPLDQDQW